jgi:hypothetical protein
LHNFTLRQHAGVALLILVAAYAAFTLAPPGSLPHPEDFSPWAYLPAVLALLWACLRLGKVQHGWAYWLIFGLCLLAFLDESGYGVEILGTKPWHIARYNVDIHDIHSLLGLGWELLLDWLQKMRWDERIFAEMLGFDLALLLGGLGFTTLVRHNLAGKKEAAWQLRIQELGLTAWVVICLAAVSALLHLPSDPKNAVFLGLSAARLLSIAALLIAGGLPLLLAIGRPAAWQRGARLFAAWMKKTPGRVYALGVAAVLLGLGFQLYAPFVFLPDQQVLIERIAPLALWLCAAGTLVLLAARQWAGQLRQPLGRRLLELLAGLGREPAFFYAAFAVLLIAIAQLIDLEYIPLNSWIQTPGFHVRLWGLWTEETFEMVAAFEFLAAAFVFPKPVKSKKK